MSTLSPVYELPIFPLGSVLVPTMVLPLHLFEPRYLALAEHLTTGSDRGDTSEFGVVLIVRGSEVGGGDVREDVGTVAALAEASRFDDGRWALVTVGVRRIRVHEWLPDDPYPRAIVEDWPDTDVVSEPLVARYRELIPELRRVLGRGAELGDPVVASTVELSDDPVTGSLQMAAVAPLGPSDRQHLLAIPGAHDRLGALHGLLHDHAEVQDARLRLSFDDGADPNDASG